MTIIVLGTLRFPKESVREIKAALLELVRATRRLDGCLSYDVAEDLFDPGLIRFSETWPNTETLTRHLGAPHIPIWRAIAAENGVTERRFTAYEANNPRSV